MGGDAPKHILDWDDIKRGFQWEILFVFGGGAMLAHGTVHSGLAAWMAEKPRLFSGSDFQRVHVADARQEDTFLLFVFVPFCHQAADLLACLLACLLAVAAKTGHGPGQRVPRSTSAGLNRRSSDCSGQQCPAHLICQFLTFYRHELHFTAVPP